MTALDHLKSALTISVITVNLLFWLLPIIPLALVKLLVPPTHVSIDPVLDAIYRAAIRVDDLWLRGVMRIDWPRPPHGLSNDRISIVISNHVCWGDILVLQSVISRDGPLLKFLGKRDLLWIPIFGAIFWAYDFPALRRASGRDAEAQAKRRADADALREACRGLRRHPAALMNFAEGTRFTPEKQMAQDTPYRFLLRPRVGGLDAMYEALDADLGEILDVTLVYPEGATFWRMLCGRVPRIDVRVERIDAKDVPRGRAALIDWLERRWTLKDATIEAARRG